MEDVSVQLEVYQRHFREWQFDVRLYTATNGFDGLILIGRHAPDLIITDLAMPEMDGFRMIHRIKSHLSMQSKIVVVTALTKRY